jgi:hypothetical protein
MFETAKRSYTLTFTVRSFGLAVKVDGKDLFSWRGEWSAVSGVGWHTLVVTNKNSVYFGVAAGNIYKINRAILTQV